MIWLSLSLGLAAWVMPVWAGKRGLRRKGLCALASGLACVLALFIVLLELFRRTRSGDQSALLDITDNLAACSVLLILGTVVAIFWMYAQASQLVRRWWQVLEYVCRGAMAVCLVRIAVQRSGADIGRADYALVEAGFPLVLCIGFTCITAVFLLFLHVGYQNRKPKSGVVCFMLQWMFTLAAFSQFLRAMSVSRTEVGAMLTETVSWYFGMAGLLWGASILCMMVGIWDLVHLGAPKQT